MQTWTKFGYGGMTSASYVVNLNVLWTCTAMKKNNVWKTVKKETNTPANPKMKKKTTISSQSSLWNSLGAGDFYMVPWQVEGSQRRVKGSTKPLTARKCVTHF